MQSLRTYLGLYSLILGLFVLALFAPIVWPSSPLQTQEKISGAYEALNFFGQSRLYPYSKFPQNSYFAAWQKLQKTYPQHTKSLDESAWESLGPHNITGRTLKMVFNPQNSNTLYAGSASGGLWRSYSGGMGAEAWHYVPTGFPVLGVSAIAFNPGDSTTLYIGTGEVYNVEAAGTGAAYRATRGSYGMGILKSTDGGKSWNISLDWSYDQNQGIWDIKISEQDPNLVFAATTDGVYRSTDAGATWLQVHDVPMANSLVLHPDDDDLLLVGSGNFASPGFGIYKSTDGGAQWTKIVNGLPTTYRGKIQLEFAPSSPNTVYASIGNGFGFSDGATWLCRSQNFGTSWTIRGRKDYSLWQGWFAHDLAVNPTDPDELAVVGITVWKSENAGITLDSLTEGGVGFSNPPIEGPDAPSNRVHSDAHDVIYHPHSTQYLLCS